MQPKWVLFFIFVTAFLCIAAGLQGCAPAKSGGPITAVSVPGPGGVSCFAVVQDGVAVGGNCL